MSSPSSRLGQIQKALAYRPPTLEPVYILSAVRTPIGSFKGGLSKATAVELGVQVTKEAIKRANLTPDQVEEIYYGNVLQGGVGQAPARQVALGAGCPVTTEATTINKVCSSGLKSITLAAQNIGTGTRDVMIAGGMESMSSAPLYYPRITGFGTVQVLDSINRDGLLDAYDNIAMGVCAEKTATEEGLTRQEQDQFALESYARSKEAWGTGKFANEVVPVTVGNPKGKGSYVVSVDEEFTRLSPDRFLKLPPAFKKDGTITAGNASVLSDGASAVILCSEKQLKTLDAKPLAKIISYADVAVAPVDFSYSPLEAAKAALAKANLQASDIALFEINEAFSATVLTVMKHLKIPRSKVNVNGGGVSLGHPLGSSGCRIVVTLCHLLKPGQYGVATLCNGGGGGSAIVIQKC